MESKLLNFPEAMKLASIVSKYFDSESLRGMAGERFGYRLFSLMELNEIILVSGLFISDITNFPEAQVIEYCAEQMVKCRLPELLEFYTTTTGSGK